MVYLLIFKKIGQKVLDYPGDFILNSELDLNVETLENGQYYLRVDFNTGKKIIPFIKNN